mmetsp:Transcript_51057/g.119471  ORF Transcript_51057/g.119471 Transcript_51057/m.119471 type:complete len:421 (-) Transcript_51057:290-1552(-)
MYLSAWSWLKSPECTSSSMPTDPLPSSSTCLNTAQSASNSDWHSTGGVSICFRSVVLMLALMAVFICSTSDMEAHGHITRKKSSMAKELFFPSKTFTNLSATRDMFANLSSETLGRRCNSAEIRSFLSSLTRRSQNSRNSPMVTLPELSSSSSRQTEPTISTSSALPAACMRFLSIVNSFSTCGSSELSTMKPRNARHASRRAGGNFIFGATASNSCIAPGASASALAPPTATSEGDGLRSLGDRSSTSSGATSGMDAGNTVVFSLPGEPCRLRLASPAKYMDTGSSGKISISEGFIFSTLPLGLRVERLPATLRRWCIRRDGMAGRGSSGTSGRKKGAPKAIPRDALASLTRRRLTAAGCKRAVTPSSSSSSSTNLGCESRVEAFVIRSMWLDVAAVFSTAVCGEASMSESCSTSPSRS